MARGLRGPRVSRAIERARRDALWSLDLELVWRVELAPEHGRRAFRDACLGHYRRDVGGAVLEESQEGGGVGPLVHDEDLRPPASLARNRWWMHPPSRARWAIRLSRSGSLLRASSTRAGSALIRSPIITDISSPLVDPVGRFDQARRITSSGPRPVAVPERRHRASTMFPCGVRACR
jgi:hypothetical protein